MSYGRLTRGRKAGKPQNPTGMLIEYIPLSPGNAAVILYQVLGEIQGARRRHFSWHMTPHQSFEFWQDFLPKRCIQASPTVWPRPVPWEFILPGLKAILACQEVSTLPPAAIPFIHSIIRQTDFSNHKMSQ
jgi:hypothetical protein